MKKIVSFLLVVILLAVAVPAMAGGYRPHPGSYYGRHGGHGGHNPWAGVAAGVVVLGSLIALEAALTPRPVVVAPAPAHGPYEQAYQQEAQRIERERFQDWERAERERGFQDARRNMGGYPR